MALKGDVTVVFIKDSQNLTVFITPVALYKWKGFPWDSLLRKGVFQHLMELLFSGLPYEVALVYKDNLIRLGKNLLLLVGHFCGAS